MTIHRSFLKWMGGKGRIIPQLLIYLPKGDRLIEPFVGGGNVFINTNHRQYVLSDINQDLINVYRHIKRDHQRLIQLIDLLFAEKPNYYEAREKFNNSCQNINRAALFIYLNRHCFNGVCRYNKNGQFNVPEGKHKNIHNPKIELMTFANKFSLFSISIDIIHCDFENTINKAGSGDIIYCDPPYLPLCGETSFNGYTPLSFDYNETDRLVFSLYKAVKRGACAVVSNHNTPDTRYLFRQFKIHSIQARRSVAANGDRKPANEIIAVLTSGMI